MRRNKDRKLEPASYRQEENMLADVIIGRSTYGGDRERDDLHRHATFSCGLRRGVRRLLKLFRLA